MVTMEGQFLVRQLYDDEITYNLIGAAVDVLSKNQDNSILINPQLHPQPIYLIWKPTLSDSRYQIFLPMIFWNYLARHFLSSARTPATTRFCRSSEQHPETSCK